MKNIQGFVWKNRSWWNIFNLRNLWIFCITKSKYDTKYYIYLVQLFNLDEIGSLVGGWFVWVSLTCQQPCLATTRCTETFSLAHQDELFSKLLLMINWFLILISICFGIIGTYFVLQNSFFKGFFSKFQCKFEFSAIMQFCYRCAQRRFFLKIYNAVCFLIIFPLNLVHKPPWEKYS